jgi:hypothetical protein
MKKLVFALVIITAAIFGISLAKAAPGPWGIALNLETKECAGFWPGDEFTAYDFPEGWKVYYPKYNPETKITTLVTDIGECDFKIREEEKCCQELGYKFVSDNIGEDHKTILRDRETFEAELKNRRDVPKNTVMSYPILIFFSLIIAVVVIAVIIRKKRRKEASDRE